jgi:hypothetical protein
VNNPRRRCTAQRTELRDDEHICSSNRVVYSTERLCSPEHPKRRSRKPSTAHSSPQLAPQTPVTQHEPTTTPHASTTTVFPPAFPHSGPRNAAQERRKTTPESPEHPQALPHLPCSPKTPHKHAVSPPPASYTPATSPTTPLTPADTPRPPSTPPFPPVHPSLPHLDCERPVLPPPTRFDWADDAESLPTAPRTQLRDLSGLKTGHAQPFGTLRRRTRRRRPPLQIFSSRNFFHSTVPSLVPPQPFITRRHPSGIGPGKPIVTIPFGTPALVSAPAPAPPVPKLDWDQDPRLADLSRALRALGWAPPC